jgi:hypothetical protein
MISACQDELRPDMNTPSTDSLFTQTTTPTIEPPLVDIWNLWRDSPHANTYGFEKGPNTYCACCHSPQNCDPEAQIDPPPNCVSCKFPSDPEIRTAIGNAFVPEEEWKNISCEVCHYRSYDGLDSKESWLNVQTGYHETVLNSTRLCKKCHIDTNTLRHRRDLGNDVHRDFTCTTCHDPHSTKASCTSSNCHPQIILSTLISGHDKEHVAVTCTACHDASGYEVGLSEDNYSWILFRTTEILGRPNTEPYQSHNLQKHVNCTRCHFPDNPWELSSISTP